MIGEIYFSFPYLQNDEYTVWKHLTNAISNTPKVLRIEAAKI